MTNQMHPVHSALDFARQHDWGCNARLKCDPVTGDALIAGLTRQHHRPNGTTWEETVAVPATVAALREFGEY